MSSSAPPRQTPQYRTTSNTQHTLQWTRRMDLESDSMPEVPEEIIQLSGPVLLFVPPYLLFKRLSKHCNLNPVASACAAFLRFPAPPLHYSVYMFKCSLHCAVCSIDSLQKQCWVLKACWHPVSLTTVPIVSTDRCAVFCCRMSCFKTHNAVALGAASYMLDHHLTLIPIIKLIACFPASLYLPVASVAAQLKQKLLTYMMIELKESVKV